MKIPNCPECRATVREKAQAFLREFLKEEKRATEVLAKGLAEGYTKRQICEAASLLQIIKSPVSHPDCKRGAGWWIWRLPASQGELKHICAKGEK